MNQYNINQNNFEMKKNKIILKTFKIDGIDKLLNFIFN